MVKHKEDTFIVLLLALVPYFIRTLYYPDYPGADDAFIHLGIIENYIHYGTIGINPGESVFMTTSPLFTFLMYWFSLLSSNILMSGIQFSIIATILSLLLVYRLAERLTGDRFLSLLALFIAAFNLHIWRWNGTFMETTPAMLGVLLLCLFFVEYLWKVDGTLRNYGIFGILLGLVTLLRPEAGILGLAFVAHDLVNGKSRLIARYSTAFAGMALVLGPAAFFAYLLFGSFVPTTLAGKTTGGFRLLNFAVPLKLVVIISSGQIAAIVLIFLAFARHAKQNFLNALDAWRHLAFLIFIPLVIFVFFYFKFTFMQSAARYFLPYLSTLPILAAGGLFVSRGSFHFPKKLIISLLAVQVVLALFLNHNRIAPVLKNMWTGYIAAQEAAADELAARCMPGDQVLVVVDIGVFSRKLAGACHIIDGGRLASPEVSGMIRTDVVEKFDVDYVVRSMGQPGVAYEILNVPMDLLWSREYPTYGVDRISSTVEVQLYKVVRGEAPSMK